MNFYMLCDYYVIVIIICVGNADVLIETESVMLMVSQHMSISMLLYVQYNTVPLQFPYKSTNT